MLDNSDCFFDDMAGDVKNDRMRTLDLRCEEALLMNVTTLL